MKPEYITYNDLTRADGSRHEGAPIMRQHSASDLRLYRAAGYVAVDVALLIVVALLAVALS